jgi:RNA polymerase sigma-70 factor (ECF subfamily)
VLDPDAVVRADRGAGLVVVRGAQEVASQALSFAALAPFATPELVNGAAGIVVPGSAVMGFTVVRGKIVEIDILVDPARLAA